MLVRSLSILAPALALASCTALFLPTEERVATTLELSPREIVVRDQDTVSLSLTLLDQHGEPFDEVPAALPVEWAVSDGELAFLRAGVLKAEKQGTGWVRVTVGELTAYSNFTVQGVPRFLRASGERSRTGTVGRPLAEPVEVRVVDRLGTGVADVAVSFRVVSGGGSVAAATVRSDTAGVARTLWTLGPAAGENALEVEADSIGGDPLRFTAAAAPDAVARLDRVSGEAQRASAGASLLEDLVVRAFDRNGNPVPDAVVTWSADGGSLTPASVLTDEQGYARARWRLDTRARALVATARSGGAEARFGATAVAGAPATLSIVAGDGQGGPEFLPLRDSLAVRVADEHDNPVAGVPVAWLVTHGGGSVASATPASTRADGTTKASWTLGISLPNAVTARAAGRSVTFTSAPVPPVPRDTLRTVSGVRYLEVELSGDSLRVGTGDLVAVYFSAYLLDGTLIERIREEDGDPPLRFEVGSGQVIVGFDEGVVGMRERSIRRLVVAPELGYRDGTMEHVPPNSTLVFDVRMVEIVPAGPATSRVPSGSRPAEVPFPGVAR